MPEKSNTYNDTVNYLYGLQKHGIKLGLDNTNKLTAALGNPQKSFKCIHLAGTNGKGSTAAEIASILQHSGYRTGLFTSPHLISFTERIRIDNQQISEQEVLDTATFVRQHIDEAGLNPTFFEVVTAMALHYFAEHAIEWAVMETGMGGRLDATNIIMPEVTVITNISMDHCEFLGSSIQDITHEKAGIIKPGIPLVTCTQEPEVITQLRDAAGRSGAEIHVYGHDFRSELKEVSLGKTLIDYSGYSKYDNLEIPLAGGHQAYNASAAVRTAEILMKAGHKITENSIRTGLKNVLLEGRLEKISDTPAIYVDGAHNQAAADVLAQAVNDLFPDKKIILITGIMGDKDIKGILTPLLQIADSIILTKAQYERAATAEQMGQILRIIEQSGVKLKSQSSTITDSVVKALETAKSICTSNSIILITGSFYTTGEAKEALGYTAVLSRLRE
ncbi:MAG: bifunctional folylpolyglutamate synthase/dihydrofolate synthase [Nitrospira sp.]|nr:bifunctional folylpolyglutamate synthase/dihydrofolate synthase [Nitrospira sp.]